MDNRLTVRAGEVIFREGSFSDRMFVVEHGSVEISRERSGRRLVLATLGPGTMFGEIGLLQSAPRSATATAAEDSVLAAIDSASLLTRIAADPMFGLQMMQRLSALVRRLTEQLVSVVDAPQADRAVAAEYSAGYL